MNSKYFDSIVLIKSKDKKNIGFGTGFVIHKTRGKTYFATCRHVVEAVGGPDKIRINTRDGEVMAMGLESSSMDLAILTVKGKTDLSAMQLSVAGFKGDSIITPGFQKDRYSHIMRPLHGILGEQTLRSGVSEDKGITYLDLYIKEETIFSIQDGYSGAPVIHEKTGTVVGITVHRIGPAGKYGSAISSKEIEKLWPNSLPPLLEENRSLPDKSDLNAMGLDKTDLNILIIINQSKEIDHISLNKKLSISESILKYRLDRLLQNKYIKAYYKLNRPTIYSLGQAGAKFLIENNIT